jgi:transposase
VADSALYRAENLHKLAATSLQWSPRVPATLTEAQEVLAQAPPATMPPVPEGSRARSLRVTYGGVAQRWVRIYAEQRPPQAQRTVDKQWRKQSEHDVKACTTLCRTGFAWEADAHQALEHCAHDWPATFLHASTICPTPRDGQRGRPGPEAQPAQMGYPIAGALTSRLTDRQARVDQQRCFLLATNALDEGQCASQAVLEGYTGQARAERGFRFLKAPQCLASSLSLKQPERILARLLVMPVC